MNTHTTIARIGLQITRRFFCGLVFEINKDGVSVGLQIGPVFLGVHIFEEPAPREEIS